MLVEPYLNAPPKTDLDGDGYISDGISIVTTDNAASGPNGATAPVYH